MLLFFDLSKALAVSLFCPRTGKVIPVTDFQAPQFVLLMIETTMQVKRRQEA